LALRHDPATSSAAVSLLQPEPGHSPTRSLARRSATLRTGIRDLTGRVVLPSSRPMALLGFFPSQVCSRRRVDARHRCRGYSRSRHFCRSGPTCRSCRPSASIIFVEVTHSPMENTIKKANEPGMMPASASGLRLPSAIRFPDPGAEETILPWALPLAGLPGTVPCIRLGSTGVRRLIVESSPLRIISPRRQDDRNRFRSRVPNPLVGFWRPSQPGVHAASCSPDEFPDLRRCCSAAADPSAF
jgi:hypothetical protein